MFKPLPLFLGLRYSRSRRRNGFIAFISASSLIGIALGVMALILGLSAMNGFERELKDRVLSVVPHGERSRVMEGLMQQALAEREAELGRIAEAYLTDPAFAQCRDDDKLWDVTIGDGLENT